MPVSKGSLRIENNKVETDVVQNHDLLQMYELPDCLKDYLLKDNNDIGQCEINDIMLSENDSKSQNLVENGGIGETKLKLPKS